MNFANNIKTIRKENNLSQEQFAEKLGVSRQAVSKWESNQSYPEMDKILLICKLFDCDIGELMNDNIKDVNETKQSKTKVNKAIEDFFDYITRCVDMFMAMTFKQKIKCVFEQIINAGVLAFICFIGWGLVSFVLKGLFDFLDHSWYQGIMSVFQSVYIIISVVLSVTVLLHIFKIRYLDYYVIVHSKTEKDENTVGAVSEDETSEAHGSDQNEAKQGFLFSRKREKIVIRDPEHSSSKFLVSVMKALVVLFKLILGFVGVFFAVGFVFVTALLIVSFLFVKSGVLFAGGFLCMVAVLAIDFVILSLIYNFITSRKNRKNIVALILIISLAMSGVGVGLVFASVARFDIVDTHITARSEFTVPMDDKLVIDSGYCLIEYAEGDFDEVKIEVIHSEYSSVELQEYGNEIYVRADSETQVLDKLRAVIKDINNKQINSYLFNAQIDKITVYASKLNIEKLKANADKQISMEEEIRELYDKTEELENEKMHLENQLAEQKMIIDEKDAELKYKDTVIEDLNAQLVGESE